MRVLNNDETKSCIEQFENLITREANISALFGVLDTVLYEYTDYILNDGHSCPTGDQAENVFYIKKIRDLFMDTKQTDKQ